MTVEHAHTRRLRTRVGAMASALVFAGTAALVGAPAASAGSNSGGTKTCSTGQIVVTRTNGAGSHYHRVDYGGIRRTDDRYTSGITKWQKAWSARVVDSWYVYVTAMVEDGYSTAICVS